MAESKLRLALISGGISPERDVSLQSGNAVFAALDRSKYTITRFDPKFDLPKLVSEADSIDIALILLHGSYGEDGRIQGLLDMVNIPYQGTGVLGSALAINKLAAKKAYEAASIPTPAYTVITPAEEKASILEKIKPLGFPVVIKPATGGSSIGMSIVKSENMLWEGLEKAFTVDTLALVEAYMPGREVTCAVMGNTRCDALPVIEIIPQNSHDFFDYTAKYQAGEALEICPADIPEDLTLQIKTFAVSAHRTLFCRGYSRTDMILTESGPMVLETNTIPGMTENSLLPKAARAAGYSFSEFLDELIALALENDHGT